MKKLLVLLTLTLHIFLAFAGNEKKVATGHHGWYIYTGTHKLYKGLGLFTQYDWRRENMITDWQQSVLRVGLDYKFNDMVSIQGGYVWAYSFLYGQQPIAHVNNEHRFYAQVVLSTKLNKIGLSNRFRLEDRWQEVYVKQTDGSFVKNGYKQLNRIRYTFSATIPLEKKKDYHWFLKCTDEIFIGFGPHLDKNVFEQNRLSIMAGYKLSSNCNFQLGYLNQYIQKGDGIHQENNHTLVAQVTYNLHFEKKAKKVSKQSNSLND